MGVLVEVESGSVSELSRYATATVVAPSAEGVEEATPRTFTLLMSVSPAVIHCCTYAASLNSGEREMGTPAKSW